jgi:hypothetical protein
VCGSMVAVVDEGGIADDVEHSRWVGIALIPVCDRRRRPGLLLMPCPMWLQARRYPR